MRLAANGDCTERQDCAYILARLGLDPCIEWCAADVNRVGAIDPVDDGYAKARFSICDPVPPCDISCP